VSTVLRLSLRRARTRIAAMALGFGLFELVVGLSYASVDQNAIRSLVESLPPALKALAGSSDVASPSGYLGSAYLHPVALTVQGALVISMASAPVRDIEDGWAELMLSRPLAPWRWILAQVAAMAIALAVVGLGGFLGGLIAITAVGALGGISMGALALVSLGGYLCFLAIGALSLAVGGLSRSGARAVGVAAGLAVVMYAIDYLAEIWTVAEPLGPLSVFHYYDPGVILGEGSIPGADVLVLAGTAIVAAVAGHLLFERRELA
jgi:ABC-type transport system involved in multi-copper enzyme maturation permease subunit